MTNVTLTNDIFSCNSAFNQLICNMNSIYKQLQLDKMINIFRFFMRVTHIPVMEDANVMQEKYRKNLYAIKFMMIFFGGVVLYLCIEMSSKNYSALLEFSKLFGANTEIDKGQVFNIKKLIKTLFLFVAIFPYYVFLILNDSLDDLSKINNIQKKIKENDYQYKFFSWIKKDLKAYSESFPTGIIDNLCARCTNKRFCENKINELDKGKELIDLWKSIYHNPRTDLRIYSEFLSARLKCVFVFDAKLMLFITSILVCAVFFLHRALEFFSGIAVSFDVSVILAVAFCLTLFFLLHYKNSVSGDVEDSGVWANFGSCSKSFSNKICVSSDYSAEYISLHCRKNNCKHCFRAEEVGNALSFDAIDKDISIRLQDHLDIMVVDKIIAVCNGEKTQQKHHLIILNELKNFLSNSFPGQENFNVSYAFPDQFHEYFSAGGERGQNIINTKLKDSNLYSANSLSFSRFSSLQSGIVSIIIYKAYFNKNLLNRIKLGVKLNSESFSKIIDKNKYGYLVIESGRVELSDPDVENVISKIVSPFVIRMALEIFRDNAKEVM